MTTTREVDELAVRFDLRRRCRAMGGPAAFARKFKLEREIVKATYEGECSPSILILDALGYRKVTRYVRSES